MSKKKKEEYSIKEVAEKLSGLFSVNNEEEEDAVREPSHYRQGRFETIDEMLIVFGPQKTYDYCIINAWKYRARAQYKGNFEQDMMKSDQYLEMAKEIVDNHSSASYPNNWSQMPPVHLIREER